MEKLKAILVDDEVNSLENLQLKLQEFCPDIDVVAVAQKPEEAISLIKQYQPEVIFLDIEMPRMNGFRLLDEFINPDFEIIFTTAYNHYAIDAIRMSAFDYLVKPVAIKELQQAVDRLLKEKQKLITREKIDVLQTGLRTAKSQENKIGIATHEGVEFLHIRNIIRVESSSNYSKLVFTEGPSMVATRLLKEFEELLVPYGFFRIHNSHLINLTYIKKYVRGDGGQVVMINGDTIDIARRKKEEFLAMIAVK